MRNLKPRTRPTPEEALRTVQDHAPSLPPTRVETDDHATTLNLRLRQSTVAALSAVARERQRTMKQLVVEGLRSIGVAVAPADLEDRTPRRRVM